MAPSPLTPDEAQWVARRRMLTSTASFIPSRPLYVNSARPYMMSEILPETLVEIGILPGQAAPENRARQAEPTQSSTPSVKSMLPERWTIEESCPKRRIVVED